MFENQQLTQLVLNLEHGVAGEVIEVEKHVGRSLIRNFEAIYASPENLKEVASSFVSIRHVGPFAWYCSSHSFIDKKIWTNNQW